jgi:uncharacterized membrane protein YqjE
VFTPGLSRRPSHPRLRQAFAALCTLAGGLALILFFLIIMGAVDPVTAWVASVVGVVLLLVWGFAFWTRHNRPDEKRIDWQDRERRGF